MREEISVYRVAGITNCRHDAVDSVCDASARSVIGGLTKLNSSAYRDYAVISGFPTEIGSRWRCQGQARRCCGWRGCTSSRRAKITDRERTREEAWVGSTLCCVSVA
jgi:hypothetical protein